MAREGERVATAVVMADGRKLTMGNVELGSDMFQEMAKIKRKEYADWILEAVTLNELQRPLGSYIKTTAE